MNGDYQANLQDDYEELIKEVMVQKSLKRDRARQYVDSNLRHNGGEFVDGWEPR